LLTSRKLSVNDIIGVITDEDIENEYDAQKEAELDALEALLARSY